MEPVSLTLGAIAAALVAKAADKTAERAVEGGAGVLRRLVAWLRERFSADQEGAAALAWVEGAPDSASRLRELAEVLDRRAHADSGFRAELKSLVDETEADGVDVASVVQTVWGNQNVQTAGVVGSVVTVTYGQPPPPAR